MDGNTDTSETKNTKDYSDKSTSTILLPCGREKDNKLSCAKLSELFDTHEYREADDNKKKDIIKHWVFQYPEKKQCNRIVGHNNIICTELEEKFKNNENIYRETIICTGIVKEKCDRLRREEEKSCFHVSAFYYQAQREIAEFTLNIEAGCITQEHYYTSVKISEKQMVSIKFLDCGGFRFTDEESVNCQTLECLMESLIIKKKILEEHRDKIINAKKTN